ncbi:GNAT family N-acetyltransferase [Dermabacter sp. Marseille-Q3180]|uniref:GNAT family N-acetyltransferase n=1 Tax=Dermabacter sp. Marseille-Q3180 TaxID=2758090 RepID=UPI0020240BAF|nr:GNAT family N-acetyltransferase [Dermabacter sp. Marseille-Q3180]
MARGRRGAKGRAHDGHYPEWWSSYECAANGMGVLVRPLAASDSRALEAFYSGLSQRTRYQRFFTSKRTLSREELKRLSRVDARDRIALVALRGGVIVGVSRLTRTAPSVADIACVVSDRLHGQGIGTILIERLAAIARSVGIETFTADVLADNDAMFRVLERTGVELERGKIEEGAVALSWSTVPTPATLAAQRERVRRAEAASMALLFDAASIMVVGASRRRDQVGAQIIRGLIASGFSGAIFPVNPEAYEINGLKSFGSIADVPGPVDLAVLALRPDRCISALEALAERGVKAVVVVSAGFADAGEEGLAAQEALVSAARAHGIRILGPSSLGFFRTGENPLNVSLAPRTSERGTIALAGQSTALSAMILAGADSRGLRVKEFLSAGNRADLSLTSALERWHSDEDIEFVALSLESLGDPARLVSHIETLSARVPVLIVRPPNEPERGPADTAREASPLPDRAINQILDRAGALRTKSVDHLLDTLALLSREGRAHGTRVGLLSNSSALGATLRAAAHEAGLDVRRENFRVPIVGDDRFVSRAFTAMAAPGGVDCVIAAILDTQRVDLVHLAQALSTLASGSAVQVLMVVVSDEPRVRVLRSALREDPSLPPVFATASRASEALATSLRAAHSRVRRPRPVPATRALTETQLEHARAALSPTPAQGALLGALGLPFNDSRRTRESECELRLRFERDDALGPVFTLALTGIAYEVFADASYARLPLRQGTAEAMLEELEAAPVLDAHVPRDCEGRARLVEALDTLAAAFLHLDSLASLTLNPVRVHAKGLEIGGCEATVGPPHGPSPDLTTLEP